MDDRAYIARRVNWHALARQRILLTGATGFVGRWMMRCPEELDITPLDRAAYANGGWRSCDWDVIIHLAPVPPQEVIENAWRNNATILYASSGAVHDAAPAEYARGKLMDVLALFESDCHVRIAELYSFVGPYNYHAVEKMIWGAIQEHCIRYNEGVIRSYLYAADLAIWLWRVLTDGINGAIYEIGAPQPVRLDEVAGLILAVLAGEDIRLQPYQDCDPRPVYYPLRARESMLELETGPTLALEEAVQKTVAWNREVYANQG